LRWARTRAGFGRVDGDTIVLVDRAPWCEPRETGATLALHGERLLPPTIPSTFFCAGLNYFGHIEHAFEAGYKQAARPTRAEVGYRANNALIGHDEDIVKPYDFDGARFECEPELVAVFGRSPGRRCSPEEAEASIFGWTIGNDVSAREWQNSDRTFWRSKNSDTFKPMGPWIETEFHLDAAETATRIDGDERARFQTGDMVFSPVEFIVEMSRYITIAPGDVLWLGADAMVQMEPGNVVEIDISGVGTLRNRVVLEEAYQ